MPLEFSEDNVTWITSKLTCPIGVLGVEVIKLRNWLLWFGCASEEFKVVAVDLDEFIVNSSLPLVTYHVLIACRLVALDKYP